MRSWLIEHAVALAVLVPVFTLWLVGQILTEWRKDRDRQPPRGFDVLPKG